MRDIFEVLGSSTRLRILATLAKHDEELPVYRLSRLSGLKRDVIRKNLPVLVEAELLLRKNYGGMRLYTLNQESTIAQKLVQFLRETKLLSLP